MTPFASAPWALFERIDAGLAVEWCTRVIALAVLLQGVELLQIRRAWSAGGIWTWEVLRTEFEILPRPVQWLLRQLLADVRFIAVVLAQIVLAGALLVLPDANPVRPALFVGLLATTGLAALRWRGTFNGGSDYMTILVLLMLALEALSRGSAAAPAVRLGCLWYLAIQAVLSYFVAGIVKLRQSDWRNGRALAQFLVGPPYEPPVFVSRRAEHSLLMRWGAWKIMLFEITFPLALLCPTACTLYLSAAFVFHLLNVAVFGLNRFVFAWAAAYPALYFCSGQTVF